MFFFFFKKKTAYDIKYGLVGSEMCKRDSLRLKQPRHSKSSGIRKLIAGKESSSADIIGFHIGPRINAAGRMDTPYTCLLYTSDAADERSSVDLGGRRIINKKKEEKKNKKNTIRELIENIEIPNDVNTAEEHK